MQFTARETKLIERLRKQEHQWPRVRWVVLSAGVFGVAVYSFILVGLYRSLDFDTLPSHEVLFFALMWPKCLLGMAVALWLIVWPMNRWQGSVNRMLLLRLLDAQQGQETRNEKPT